MHYTDFANPELLEKIPRSAISKPMRGLPWAGAMMRFASITG